MPSRISSACGPRRALRRPTSITANAGARMSKRIGFPGVLVAGALLLPCAAGALEGGIGRTITGQQVNSYAGIVPPTPGFVFSISSIDYKGDMGSTRQVPFGGAVSRGLDASVSY